MPLAPNWIERFVFLTLNQGPGASLDMWSGPAFHCVLAALRLNVFETLRDGALTAEQTASKLNTDARGTCILLDTLEALGYVRKQNGAYANTGITRKWLLNGGAINFTPFYLYWGAIMEQFMPNLEESIRSGSPPVNVYEWIEDQPEVSRYFQEGMIALAQYIVGDVVRALPVPDGSTRLLDVGGGHGTYSIALCRQHPGLSAVVFDGAQALVTGRRAVEEAGLSQRVTLHEGDFMTDELPGGFDLALVFNIVHGLLPDGNLDLFRKIKRALNPGGRIVILEQIHGVSPLPITSAITHILSAVFFHLLGGQVYTDDDLRGWLAQAGYTNVQRKNILKAGSAVITGVVS